MRSETDRAIFPIPARFDHGPWGHPAHSLYRNRIKDKSFLWTVIRDPTKRMVSMFFHMIVSREKKEPTDEQFQRYILENSPVFHTDYYFRTLYTKSPYERSKIDPMMPITTANQILEEYDFIGITERMDESAVVLMMLLGLPMSDVLFLSAKGHGGYDDGGGRGAQHVCTYIWPSFVSPGMREFFDTNAEWQSMVKYDLEFYKAANASLDLTIDALGRDQFTSNLVKFRKAQVAAQEKCLPTTVFPCDLAGHWHESTDCIWNDSGCGVKCLDEIADELGLSQ